MFDKVVCLNLDKRIHEQERIATEFSQHGMNVEFFLAGDGTSSSAYKYDHVDVVPRIARSGYPAWVNRSNSYNAFLCYKKIIKKAKAEKRTSVTLVEDDCVLQPNFTEVMGYVKEELKGVPYWDMLYCCANHTWTSTIQVAPHLLRLQGSGGFQFVTIRSSLFDVFINMGMFGPIDEQAGKLHAAYNCYATWPNIAIPKPGYSYCEGYEYDNTELYKNKGCP